MSKNKEKLKKEIENVEKHMLHLNGNLLCSIDTESTGLVPNYNDLLQVAIIPLDYNLDPLKSIMPFCIYIKPRFPENVEPEAMRVNGLNLAEIEINGYDYFKAADIFYDWFNRLGLPEGKKISPLGQNYSHDKGFLKDWLGDKSYNFYFDYHDRDCVASALYANDKSWFHNIPFPYPKVKLSYLCSQLKIKNIKAHDAVADALTTARIYKAMLRYEHKYSEVFMERTRYYSQKIMDEGRERSETPLEVLNRLMPEPGFGDFDQEG